jgi:hypothetical protein
MSKRLHREGFRYTWFIVSHNRDKHVPVLIGPNGKIPLNEAVTRAHKLESAVLNYFKAVLKAQVDTRRVTLAEYKALVKPVRNSGGKKRATKAKA